ncbi:MAG: GNAT family N-acetyltransferase [Candidatus Bipolaricaulota bacterium]|nr:GNAT family N-acetyltransferase [Candidatus Bipolaricaulota bacterium]
MADGRAGKGRIRPLTIDDYDALVCLWQEAGLPYRPDGRDRRERIARELEGPCSVFLAAEEDGRLVGAILGTHDGRKGWMNRLVVAPSHRRKGVGAALVREVERRLAELGIEVIACLIEDWNRNSIEFFSAIGYVYDKEVLYYSRRKDERS